MATKKELVDYINTNLNKGYNEEQIRQALKQAGHSKTIIDAAFKQASKDRLSASLPAPTKVTTPQKTQQMPTTQSVDQPLSPDTEKILSALAYPIGIIAIVLLIISKKENRLGKFHGYQALFFNILWYVLVTIVYVFAFIPYVGFLFSIFGWLVGLAFLVFSIILAVQVYQGKLVKVPVIYNIVPASDRL